MKTSNLKLIGKGLFSKVYRLDEKEVLIKSVCKVKECLSMGWHDSVNIFPEITRIDDQTYTMEYFEKVTSLKDCLSPAHYEIYKNLKSLSVGHVPNKHNLYDAWYKEFKKVKNVRFRNALINMIETLSNYGSDIQFEISPRNVAVKNGKLILLDVFYMQSQCLDQRNSKKRKAA